MWDSLFKSGAVQDALDYSESLEINYPGALYPYAGSYFSFGPGLFVTAMHNYYNDSLQAFASSINLTGNASVNVGSGYVPMGSPGPWNIRGFNPASEGYLSSPGFYKDMLVLSGSGIGPDVVSLGTFLDPADYANTNASLDFTWAGYPLNTQGNPVPTVRHGSMSSVSTLSGSGPMQISDYRYADSQALDGPVWPGFSGSPIMLELGLSDPVTGAEGADVISFGVVTNGVPTGSSVIDGGGVMFTPNELQQLAQAAVSAGLSPEQLGRFYFFGSANGSAGSGFDTIISTVANDVVVGGDLDEIIDGLVGSDLLFGGKGSDTFVAHDGDGLDLIHGGDNSIDGSSLTPSGGADLRGDADGIDLIKYDALSSGINFATSTINGVDAQVIHNGGFDYLVSIEKISATSYSDDFSFGPDQSRNASFYVDAGAEADLADYLGFDSSVSGIDFDISEELIDGIATSAIVVSRPTSAGSATDTLVNFEFVTGSDGVNKFNLSGTYSGYSDLHLDGAGGDDIFTVTDSSFVALNGATLDGGAGIDTLDLSAMGNGVIATIASSKLSLRSTGEAPGSDASSEANVQNIEKFVGTQFVDVIDAKVAGLQVTSGGGEDHVNFASRFALFADAAEEDHIYYNGRELKGVLGWGNAMEKSSLFSLSEGVNYLINEDNELVITGVGGQQIFVAGFQSGPDAKYDTAGIRLAIAQLAAYRLLDPAYPGAQAYFDGFAQLMDEIRARFMDEEVVGVDPLVLDLDGDGLELSARSSISPMFDIDNDGFAERSAWVFGGDGFLAIDANNDGIINNVSELFGDASSSGFEELATYDINLDGVIDASDAVFSDLKVWVDANADGVTDSGELFTLSELDIESISLPGTPGETVIQAGNVIAQSSSFTLVGGATRTIADVRFNVDQVNTEFLGDTSISAAASALPELNGSGELPSLRIAATLEPSLIDIVEAAAEGANLVDLVGLAANIRPLLNAWAAGDYTSQGAGAELAELPADIHYQYAINESGAVEVTRYVYAAVHIVDDVSVTYYKSTSGTIPAADSERGPTLSEAIAWLESEAASSGGFVGTFGAAEVETLERFTGADVPLEVIFGDPEAGPLNTHALDTANSDQRGALRQYIEAHANLEVRSGVAFAIQSGLAGYFPEVSYDEEEGVFVSDTAGDLQAAYLAILDDAPANSGDAIGYLAEWAPVLKVFLAQYARGESHLVNSYSYQFGNLVRGYEALGSFPTDIASAAVALGIPGVVITSGTGGADIFYVSNGDEFLNGGEGVDSYVFGNNFGDVVIDDREAIGQNSAPDNLRFAVHDSTDVIATRDGNDLILTFVATDQSVRVNDQFLRERYSSVGTRLDDDRGVVEIVFADGVVWDEFDIAQAVSHPESASETIVGTRHVDWLDGGAGDDLLEGGNSTDIYIFGEGYGNDTIHEYGADVTTDNEIFILLEGDDFVRFAEGITYEDLVFSRDGGSPDLLITLSSTGETLAVADQFVATNTGPFGLLWYNRIENFSFDEDGSMLSWEDILKEVVQSTSGNDTIYGFYYKDTLDGGEGDDFLSGGDESDIYYFGIGDGSDTIKEGQTNVLTPSLDKIVFKSGVTVEDVTFARDGGTNDLIITINSSGDQIRVVDQYTVTETGPFGTQAFDRIETFEWADGTVKEWTTLRQEIIDAASTDGNDTIYGTHFDDAIHGGLGDDLLKGGSGADTYTYALGDGNDVIDDYLGNQLAGDGDRLVFTDLVASDFTLSRGGVISGTDLILKHTASGATITIVDQFWYTTLVNVKFNEIEYVEFADSEVWTIPDIRQIWLDQNSTSGDDTIDGFWTDDTIVGGAGNDILIGGDGSDTYVFELGDGVDTIKEGVGNVFYEDDDVVQFGTGLTLANALFSRVGDDLVIGFAGKSELVTIEGQFTSAAYFGSWTDIEIFSFDAGADVVTDVDIQIALLAEQSTSGDDTITGFFTADTLSGGLGNDTLKGSTGGDTYLFDLGDGNDTIIEGLDDHPFLDGQDRILFGAGIARADVTFSLVGDDFLVSIAGGDSILIQDYAANANRKVELFEFADGTVLTSTEAENNALASQATTGDDVINATSGSDTLQGGLGNDTLHGGDGSDTYIFARGDGVDLIDDNGYFDTDVLVIHGYTPDETQVARGGTSGGDLILTFAGTADQITIPDSLNENIQDEVEQIVFDDGTVWTSQTIREQLLLDASTDGDDLIEGFVGRAYVTGISDVLEGGLGNDVLQGGPGSDTYVFSQGDGHDEITDAGYFSTDKLVIHGYAPSDLTLEAAGEDGYDLIITFNGTDDRITIRDTLNGSIQNEVEQIVFDDGTVWTMADARAYLLLEQMSSGDDVITGFDEPDTLQGGPGDDVLHGLDGSDTYVFTIGDGHDEIQDNGYFDTDKLVINGYEVSDLRLAASGDAREDLIITFLGSDDRIKIHNTLNGSIPDEIEQIVFDDGTIWTMADVRPRILQQQSTAGDDFILGLNGNDTLEGGLGNDTLHGNDGSDTYVFSAGDGVDEIEDNGAGDTDRLLIHGFETGDVSFERGTESEDDLIITFDGSSDQITIRNTLGLDSSDHIELVEFDDGTIWDWSDIVARLPLDNGGDDLMTGTIGDDMLEGGPGNDVLHGLDGSDTYIFNQGDGVDEIKDGGNGDTDRLLIHDYAVADVILGRGAGASADLILRFAGTSDQITVRNTLNDNWADKIEQIEFDDSTVWTMADLRTQLLVEATTIGADTIDGFNFDDTLEGGLGNDVLHGLDGSDTYIFNQGDGVDEIKDGGNGDTDRLLIHDYAVADVILGRGAGASADLILRFAGTSDQITVRNTLNDNWADKIEQIEFDDSTVWTMADLRTQLLVEATTIGADTIDGFNFDDTLEGGLGNDVLHGLDGSDTYIFNQGDGVDEIKDGGNGDTDRLLIHDYGIEDVVLHRGPNSDNDLLITFIASDDRILVRNTLNGHYQDGIEEVVFDDGTIWVTADLLDRITADPASDDVLEGTSGNDTLEGGLGNDVLHGYGGSDTYVFNQGDGVDEIEDNGAGNTDRLLIHDYAAADVILGRGAGYSDDLILTFAGTSDQITVWNTLNGAYADAIEEIVFDDATVWTMADLRAALVAQASTSGADVIDGFSPDDTIEGGLGNDVLHGYGGSDTYVFNQGDGVDEIEDNGAGNTDRLLIHDYAAADVILGRGAGYSDDLILTFAGTSDQITVWNTLNGDYADGIEEIVFDDATVWTMADLRAALVAQASTSGADVIDGFSPDDTIEGGLGNDVLHGYGGSDTYVFNQGDGVDEIEDNGGGNTDRLLIHDYAVADVIVSRGSGSSNDLVLRFVGSSDQITIRNTLNGNYGDAIEQIVFDDSTVWTMADVNDILDNGLAPVVFDLNRDGTYFADTEVAFDFDADERIEIGAWMASGDGVLALDRDGNGQIDSGSEISFVEDLPGAQTDLEGLSSYDENADGVLTSADGTFDEFLLWIDRNMNGVSDTGELMSLSDAGIVAINLLSEDYKGPQHGTEAYIFGEASVLMNDGSVIQAADAQLNYQELDEGSSEWTMPSEISRAGIEDGAHHWIRPIVDWFAANHDFDRFGFASAAFDSGEPGSTSHRLQRQIEPDMGRALLGNDRDSKIGFAVNDLDAAWEGKKTADADGFSRLAQDRFDFSHLDASRPVEWAVEHALEIPTHESLPFDELAFGWIEDLQTDFHPVQFSHAFQQPDFDHSGTWN